MLNNEENINKLLFRFLVNFKKDDINDIDFRQRYDFLLK